MKKVLLTLALGLAALVTSSLVFALLIEHLAVSTTKCASAAMALTEAPPRKSLTSAHGRSFSSAKTARAPAWTALVFPYEPFE